MRTRRAWGVLAGWAAAGGAAAWSLVWLGRFPYLRVAWSDLGGWLQRTDPTTAVAAFGRTAALAIVAWVALTTLAYALMRLAGARPVSWLSIGPLRRAVDAVLAGTLVVASMAPAAATDQVSPSYVPVPAGQVSTESEAQPAIASPATARAVESEVIVSPGDSMWTLAETHLAATWGRPPTDAETAPYWVDVVEANRSRIRSGDPDLIFPGETIMLPPVGES